MNQQLIQQTALATIKIEADTIQKLSDSINSIFVDCVQHIFQSSGRLIATGIGKSAIIGQKIVATLNSTGTPAFFMHAADAIHGDLGMIRSNDTILCLSKSGETPEIKVLVPLVKKLGNRLIGMVSNPNSFLGQQADYVLHTPITQEADPNNLAPTASTTAQMVMGDALATALLALRGFTPKDFAQFHPGGALGKQLYLKVSDIASQNAVPKVDETADIKTIIIEMTSKRLGATAVLNSEERLVGIITDGDLRRMLNNHHPQNPITAQVIMSQQPKTIQQDSLAINALALMQEYSISQLIVLDKQRYVGIIHLHDLVKEGIV